MPRRPRLNFPGVIHHVIQRGNNREYILEDERARNYLLTLFRQAVVEDGADIFAYVVMNNHYHMAIRSREKSLSTVMHRINTTFGLAYNSRLSRTGHVFQGRFKAIPILEERYLMAVIRYIHHNPVAARICERPEDYRWSSDAYYRQLGDGFVDSRSPLAWFADDNETARRRYSEYMLAGDEINWEDFVYIDDEEVRLKQEETACDAELSARVSPKLLDKAHHRSQPEVKSNLPVTPEVDAVAVAMSLEEILISTGITTAEREAILAGSRQRKLLPYKMEFARSAYRQGYNLQQIARHLNVTPTTIYHYLK